MYIAQQKQKENIAEYIIYMWQIEALIRSCEFNIYMVEEIIISQYTLTTEQYNEVKNWYKELISIMKKEKLEKKGHISEINHILMELNSLHDMLLNMFKDPKYIALCNDAAISIKELRNKSGNAQIADIELCLNGLYGVLSLKMRKKEVTQETQEAVATFGNMLAFLAKKYHKMKAGEFELPMAAKN